jgi:hypothetical protein
MSTLFNQNNQKYKESESAILNLEVLSMKYKNLLIQYKQAVADYINYLNYSTADNKTLTSISGQAYWGTGPAGNNAATNNVKSVSECAVLCLNNSTCTGATYTSSVAGSLPICWLRTGDSDPVPSKTNDNAILPTGKYMLLNIQSINNQLNTVNKRILEIINDSNKIFSEQSVERSKNAEEMLTQYIKLNKERATIQNMVKEYETLDEAQIQGDLKVSENYYSFLLLFAFCILIFIILYKFSISSSSSSSSSSSGLFQQGGEIGGINFNYIILAFIILLIFIYYYSFIYNYTAGIISSTGSYIYNTFRI